MFKVLHVDENFFYKEILKKISVENAFECFFASKPSNAYEIISNNRIDLIITSLEFEGDEKGEEFILQIKQSEDKNIPIIVLTSYDNQKLKNKLMSMGILDFLVKGDFNENLISHISNLKTEDVLSHQLQNMKIAVLDDDKLQLLIIKNIFKENNIKNVDYYTNPHDLLSNKEEYGIYLIDYILPGISGDKVIEIIRNKNEYSVIMAISGIEDENTISRILSMGADDYITKPYSVNVFIARLKANVRTYNLLKKLKEKNQILEKVVKIDGLTQLLSHKYIIEQLEQELSRCHRHHCPFSIIMIVIDDFKFINDTYGHPCGDEVLIELSNFMQSALRKIDTIGRYGGEEFLVLLPESNLTNACITGERLRKEVEELFFSKDKIKFTISLGIVEYRNENPFDLIKKADKLLYKAKKSGKNKIEY